MRSGKNQYTFVISNTKLTSYKNAYLTVRFDGKSNWSKLVKVSGKATSKKYKMPKRDKDGTYTTAINKRFDWTYNGCKIDVCGGKELGTWDDGDGWIYVTAQASRCAKCNETLYAFVMANWNAIDPSTDHECYSNKWGTYVQIAFDKKTGKVVNGTPLVLERYPFGTFFMDVD